MIRLRIRTKLLLIALGVSLLATAGSTALFYAAEKRDLLQGVDAVLLTGAYGAMRVAGPAYYDRIEGPQSIPASEYRRLMDRLSEYAQEISARWVYTYMQTGDDFVYVACSSPPEDIQNDSYARFFEKYETPPAALRATMADGQTRWTQYDDPTGTYHSVFVRRLTRSGRPYVVGVDVPSSFVEQRLRATALRGAAFGLGGLLAISLGLGVVVSRVVRPLRELTGHTSRLAERDFRWDDEAQRQVAAIARGSGDEVGALAGVLTEMERKLREYVVTLTETTAAKERMASELAIGREIQMGLLPELSEQIRTRSDLALHAVMAPAKEVGGDLYDFFLLDDDRLFFLIGDVSDKGVPAALFMAVTTTLFRAHALDAGASIDLVTSRVNQALVRRNPSQFFVTAFAAVLDARSGDITYCDAGHPPPFVLRGDGRVEEHQKTGGLVLACEDGFPYGCGAIRLERGDSIVVYTDGVTEAMSEERRPFGSDGMRRAFASCGAAPAPQRVTEVLMAEIRAHAGSAPQSDDIAILAIQYLGRKARSARSA